MASNKVIEYFDLQSSKWSSKYKKYSFSARSLLFDYVFSKHLCSNQAVLDLGCGAGDLTSLMLKYKCFVHGVDISKSMIEYYKSRFISNSSVGFELIDPKQPIPFKPRTFDAIISSSVLEYVESPTSFLQDIYSILKDDGYLIISVPCSLSPVRFIQSILRKLFAPFIDIYSYLEISKNSYSFRSFSILLLSNSMYVKDLYKLHSMPVLKHIPFIPPSLYVFVVEKM